MTTNKSTNALPEGFSAGLASAKRTRNERRGMHSWHPYYAGYSEAFVASALSYLSVQQDAIVLDPWGGSGTTSIVAGKNGVSSIALDINPAMSIFSAAKSLNVVKRKVAINAYLQQITTQISKASTSSDASTAFDLIRKSIPFTPSIRRPSQANQKALKALSEKATAINPAYAFCIAAAFCSLRKSSISDQGTNPTWIKSERTTIELIDMAAFAQTLMFTATKMLFEVEEFYNATNSAADSLSSIGDARSLPIRDSSVDAVITSPPYLTRIDYAVSTGPELKLLGGESLLTNTRHETTGAPVIRKIEFSQELGWGSKCNQILCDVASHSSKAAKSYYWKNLVQYFKDVSDSLDEIFRALKPGGSGLVVVQGSYFKEIEIPLGEIYVEMAELKGFEAHIASRDVVKGHMAHVNTKSSKYKSNKVYYEDCVFIRKR